MRFRRREAFEKRQVAYRQREDAGALSRRICGGKRQGTGNRRRDEGLCPLSGASERKQRAGFRRPSQRSASAFEAERGSQRIPRRKVPLYSRGRVSGHQRGAV